MVVVKRLLAHRFIPARSPRLLWPPRGCPTRISEDRAARRRERGWKDRRQGGLAGATMNVRFEGKLDIEGLRSRVIGSIGGRLNGR